MKWVTWWKNFHQRVMTLPLVLIWYPPSRAFFFFIHAVQFPNENHFKELFPIGDGPSNAVLVVRHKLTLNNNLQFVPQREDGLACIQPICQLGTMWQLANMDFSPVMQSGYIASLLTCCCSSIKRSVSTGMMYGSVVMSPCAFCVGVNFASGLILVYICPTGVHRRQDHP